MSKILEVEFEYGFKPDERQRALLEAATKEPVKLADDGTLNWGFRTFLLTLDEACSVGAAFSVRKSHPFMREVDDLREPIGPAPVNQRCNVVVAGTEVLKVKTVMLLADACTDDLQRHLNEGWRILAVCVQPDQRRPDYILGAGVGSE